MRLAQLFVVVSMCLASTPSLADGFPSGFREYALNGPLRPVAEGGITTFKLVDQQCSTVVYGDGRGEHDCLNGSVRSNLIATPAARMGEALEYRFDVLVDPALAYPGRQHAPSAGYLPDAWDSMLTVASWEGNHLHNFLYQLKLDATKGLTFLGAACQSPESFGQWVAFSMKVRWADDERGWIKVSCDDRVIYAAEALATNQAPHCWVTNQCEVGIVKNPSSIQFVLGPVMSGAGYAYKEIGLDTPFDEIQPDGIRIQMRNIAVNQNPALYDGDDAAVITALQTRLNELGCDVGAPDGIVGRRTREQALSCRQFPEGTLPSTFSALTLRAFHNAYLADGAVELPAGTLPEPGYVIHVAQDGPYHIGPRDIQADAYIRGRIIGARPGEDALVFLLSGQFDYANGNYSRLQLILDHDVGRTGADRLSSCPGISIIDWGDGKSRPAIQLTKVGDNFEAQVGVCPFEALQGPAKFAFEILVTRFKDIADSMVRDGAIALMPQEGARRFMERVASGEIRVGTGEVVDRSTGLIERKLKVAILGSGSQTSGRASDVVADFHGPVGDLNLGFEMLDFLLVGTYDPSQDTFSFLRIILEKDAGPIQAKVASCAGVVTETWDDGSTHVGFDFTRTGNRFVNRGADCALAALPPGIRQEAALLVDNFADIAVGMVVDGLVESFPHEGVRSFLEQVARGEIEVGRAE